MVSKFEHWVSKTLLLFCSMWRRVCSGNNLWKRGLYHRQQIGEVVNSNTYQPLTKRCCNLPGSWTHSWTLTLVTLMPKHDGLRLWGQFLQNEDLTNKRTPRCVRFRMLASRDCSPMWATMLLFVFSFNCTTHWTEELLQWLFMRIKEIVPGNWLVQSLP